MTYKLSQQAETDIIDIYLQGKEQFGVNQAESYHLSMKGFFALLSENPELAREREELNPPIRVYPYGSHLILYKVEENRDVFIVIIRHSHEDWHDQI